MRCSHLVCKLELQFLFLLIILPAELSIGASGQTVFSDGEFLAVDYLTNSNIPSNADVRFNIDYSSIDIFDDGFLIASIPEAPNTPATASQTTGVFLSANNDSSNPVTPQETFAAIMPELANVNVGDGTTTPDFRMRVDVFHSTGAGIADGMGSTDKIGATNYAMVGLNQLNPVVQIEELNAPPSGNLAGQGLRLSITGDSGAAEDYLPNYAGANYRDRPNILTPGQFYSPPQPGLETGLITDTINNFWLTQGFELVDPTSTLTDDLFAFTGNSLFISPDPANPAGFRGDASGQHVSFFADHFPLTSDPIHYTGGGVTPPASLLDTDDGLIRPGVQPNRWAVHELFWVDEQFTYVIDGVPVLQITPDADGLNGDDNVFDPFSDSGTVLLAFWDRFGGSVASSPRGANFVIYDNLLIEEATVADVPNVNQYLVDNGYLPVPEPRVHVLVLAGMALAGVRRQPKG